MGGVMKRLNSILLNVFNRSINQLDNYIFYSNFEWQK